MREKKRAALGVVLRRQRMKVPGRTLEIVAEETGIDPDFLIKIENGQWIASNQVLKKIARVLKVNLQDLVDLVEEVSKMTREELDQKILEV
ncbi:MAG: helix-turn-helix domain-containing protein [bacterium]|nr:helix-turn-helix domain-containing protein [bacterium]